MGGERPRVRAAVHPLQDRRLGLDETAVVQFFTHRPRHCRPQLGHPARSRVDDQVYITLPDPRLWIRQAMVLVGKRPKGLGRDGEPGGQDGQLTAPGRDDLAFRPDVIPEVHVALPGRERVLAEPVGREHHLDVAGAVADGREAQLPGDAGQHHPAGDADALPRGGVRCQVAGP